MPDAGSVEDFYDRLAGNYHLIFEDWRASGRWQAGVLLPVLEAAAGGTVRTLFDATCGIGTQAIPFAERGLEVRGSDISPAAIERARAEAAAAGVAVELEVGDVRALPSSDADAVVSLDNSLAHLTGDGDLERAIASMASCARPGGAVAVSLRDYDTETGTEAVRRVGEAPDRRAVVTFWRWEPDGLRYRLDHVVLAETVDGWSLVTSGSVACRAHRRAEVERAFTAAGLRDVRSLLPDESGYYQPLIVGTRA